MDKTKNPPTLRRKLKTLAEAFKTFAVTDEAEKKKNGSKESAYKYTPGWKIIESIREKMDELDIMLDTEIVSEKHEMISYPVYKVVENNNIQKFEKKEMYVTLECNFTWVDVDTNETVGPIKMISSGANGIDKSISSAMSLAEKYFLLKYFHITTREKDEEPEAHDSETLPGIPSSEQPITPAECAKRANPPYAMPVQPQAQPQQMPAQQYPNQTQQQTPDQVYENAVRTLMNFDKGTRSHADALNRVMVSLNLAGYNTADPTFATTLVDTAYRRRMG